MIRWHHVSSALRHLQEQAQSLRSTLTDRLKGTLGEGDASVMLQLARPNLGQTPRTLRRVLEPVVALSAMAALAMLLALGVTSLTTFLLVGALMYAILTYVFGIELGIQMPPMASF